jgi:hypothetical protein
MNSRIVRHSPMSRPLALAVALLCCVPQSSRGDNVVQFIPADFAPAHFTDEPRSLQNLIVFPKIRFEGTATLQCDAQASSTGRLRGTACYEVDNRYGAFERAIYRAAAVATIAPASVAGKPRAVWFQYRVEFVKNGANQSVRAYPNYGLQIDTYGPNYTSPQRLDDMGVEFFLRCRDLRKVWVQASITEAGRPEQVYVLGGGAARPCRQHLIDMLRKSTFIPAHVDGTPVRARYAELFWNREIARPL